MVDEKILELFNQRRILLKNFLNEMKDDGGSNILVQEHLLERIDLIDEMSILTSSINELCKNDYILIDMYRRLSLAIAKEDYENAVEVREEIINYKN